MKGPHVVNDVIASRYVVEGFVGEGGMQYVYKARDTLLDRFVALKTPKNMSAKKRFHRSAVVSAKINHPHVAKTLDYIETDGHYYLVEELIEGEDLAKSLIATSYYLDPYLVAKIFHHLAKGVAASHHVGVVHRDLKPTNIMVVGKYQLDAIKITDFGIAKMAFEEIAEAAEGGDESISASATAVGALPYMSPEAINTPRTVGVPADIWSLGAMIYELLTGNKPFGTGLKAVGRILVANYDPLPLFVTSNPQFSYLSNQIFELIKRCLVLDIHARPTADMLVEECGKLCYPTVKRLSGILQAPKNQSWGFITESSGADVFYHKDSIYGQRPLAGDVVMYSKYTGGGADRAIPVVRLR